MALVGERSSGYRTYETYENAKNDNAEVEQSFNWELRWDTKPTGVYIPPDITLAIRLQSVTPPQLQATPLQEIEVNGWKTQQFGLNDSYSGGTFSGEYQDYIDQSIEYCFREMVYESDRPEDHTQRPKAELIWSGRLFQLDSQDRPIKVYNMRDCLLSEYNKTEQYDHTKTAGGKITIGWTFGLCTVQQLNIPRI